MTVNHEVAVSKFDREISRVITMCNNLQSELDELKNQMIGVDNNFSAKLLSNKNFSLFVGRYSEIVRSYESACKEFSKVNPALEKIMFGESEAQHLINDVKQVMGEAEASISFDTNFENSTSFLFEVLAPTLNRVIEAGKSISEKIREDVKPRMKKNLDSPINLFAIIFGIMLLTGLFMVSWGLFKHRSGSVGFGSILVFSSSVLFFWNRWEERSSQNTQKN